MSSEPTLPPELEHKIFETAALLHRARIPTFLRVCHRVHVWLEPLLYRVLDLHEPSLVEYILGILDSEQAESHSRPKRKPLISKILRWGNPMAEVAEGKRTTFLKTTVRHIVFSLTLMSPSHGAEPQWQRISRILSLNPTIFELVIKSCMVLMTRFPLPLQLRPTRVVLEFNRDYGDTVDLTEPLFSNVTHLTLLNTAVSRRNPETWAHWGPALPALPALTHLCVSDNIAMAIIPTVLSACPHLQALVALWWTQVLSKWSSEALRRDVARSRRRMEAFEQRLRTAEAAHCDVSQSQRRMEVFEQRVFTVPDARIVLMAAPFFEQWERSARSGRCNMWDRVDEFIAHKREGVIDSTRYILEERAPEVDAVGFIITRNRSEKMVD
ncbi:hypothetical protein DFH07DRAFT_140294 [Mycena maculata]|uniref:Uncharacterized protein n=1 Tax=Mycena maculata TaxID=230809 RepID=A0AAD7JZE6_9AGAR|nr:hypothetical protein DFH07DRAFT_140294 [Mycena maculata]